MFIKSANGQLFSITVNAMTEHQYHLHLWGKRNPKSLSTALTIRMLKDLDVISQKEFDEYISAIVEHSDTSGIGNLKDILERLGKDK